jgi:hypothetical protein
MSAETLVLDVEAERAEAERLAQGLPARLEDPTAQARIITAMRG